MAAPQARVRRDGSIKVIAAREIVPGDILLFEAGDKVTADARLTEASNLKVNEARPREERGRAPTGRGSRDRF